MANWTVPRLSPPEIGIRYRPSPPPPLQRGTGAYIPFRKAVQTPTQMNGYGMGRDGGAAQRPLPAVRFVAPVRSGLMMGRESGTGVSLPHTAFMVDGGKKPGGTNDGGEQQKQATRNARRQQGEAAMIAELGLPHEWTY